MAEPKDPNPGAGGTAATVGNKSERQVPGVSAATAAPNSPGSQPERSSPQPNDPLEGDASTKRTREQQEAAAKQNEADVAKQKATPQDHDVIGVDKIKALVDVLPTDTPKDHVFWGYGGYRVKYEDLLHIVGKK
jgi:hypothetical protein